MLEIGIIICLAGLLFLTLKNFSKAGENLESFKEVKMGIWEKIFKKDNVATEIEIENEINRDQNNIISPLDLNNAEKRFMEKDPEINRTLLEADKAFISNDLRTAEDLSLEVLSKEKKCSSAYIMIGKVAFQRGSFGDAKEAFKAAIKCKDQSGESYYYLGLIEVRQENVHESINFFQKAIDCDRNQPEWWAEFGKAFNDIRQFAKAAKAFKKASSLDIDNGEYKQLASDAEEKQRAHAAAFRRK